MRHWWWKVLCVLLLVYTAVVGLRTPLKPAIVQVAPDRIKAGENTLTITGYGTNFQSNAPLSVALVNDGQHVCATWGDALSPTLINVVFTVPNGFRKELTSIVIEKGDDVLIMPEALWTEDRGDGIPEQACVPPHAPTAHKDFGFPNRSILNETIRNLFFHVPMWFTMIVLMGISFFFSIKHLRTGNLGDDLAASIAVNVSLLFGILGITTGSLWARATWGGWWTYDTKLNGSALTLLMYFAYVVLRGSVPDAHKRGRLAAVYNIFAFMLMLVFIMVLPRLTDSLHPGNGGNPAFSQYDLDSALKSVFYPACLGWILLGIWAFNLRLRHGRLIALLDENEAH